MMYILILMLEICITTVISEGTCIVGNTMHKLVQYFQTLHRNEDIYELKGNLNSAAL